MNENNWYIKGNFFPEQFSDDPAFRMRFRVTLWAHRTRIPTISSLHTVRLGVLRLARSTLGSNLFVEDVSTKFTTLHLQTTLIIYTDEQSDQTLSRRLRGFFVVEIKIVKPVHGHWRYRQTPMTARHYYVDVTKRSFSRSTPGCNGATCENVRQMSVFMNNGIHTYS